MAGRSGRLPPRVGLSCSAAVPTGTLSAGNRNVLVTERRASFGYNTLVSDMRALPILARTTGAPVIFDANHSVQQAGGNGTSSGGASVSLFRCWRVPRSASPACSPKSIPILIMRRRTVQHVPLREFEGLVRTLMAFVALAKSTAP